jgi:hypothetical protein
MRYAGAIFAKHYQQPELELSLGQSLSKALQADARVLAYLAYKPEPSGAMIAFESEDSLTAMLLVNDGSVLEHRLFYEARSRQKTAWILTALTEHTQAVGSMGLERWSIR